MILDDEGRERVSAVLMEYENAGEASPEGGYDDASNPGLRDKPSLGRV